MCKYLCICIYAITQIQIQMHTHTDTAQQTALVCFYFASLVVCVFFLCFLFNCKLLPKRLRTRTPLAGTARTRNSNRTETEHEMQFTNRCTNAIMLEYHHHHDGGKTPSALSLSHFLSGSLSLSSASPVTRSRRAEIPMTRLPRSAARKKPKQK